MRTHNRIVRWSETKLERSRERERERPVGCRGKQSWPRPRWTGYSGHKRRLGLCSFVQSIQSGKQWLTKKPRLVSISVVEQIWWYAMGGNINTWGHRTSFLLYMWYVDVYVYMNEWERKEIRHWPLEIYMYKHTHTHTHTELEDGIWIDQCDNSKNV